MATAFVTGATGCLGTNLVGELVAEGWRVHVEGTRNVVAAALARRARRLVQTSTAGTIGEHGEGITEETPSTASSSRVLTFRTKWEGEQEVRRGLARGLDAVIMNQAVFTGPHDRHTWSRLFRMVQDGQLPLAPSGRNSWAHVREVARANIAASRLGPSGENYILAGADATWLEALRIIGELVGRPGPRRTMPTWLLRGVGRTMHLASLVTGREPAITPEGAEILAMECTFDCSKAVRELGYRPVPLREILEDCHRWMVTEGLLAPGRR